MVSISIYPFIVYYHDFCWWSHGSNGKNEEYL